MGSPQQLSLKVKSISKSGEILKYQIRDSHIKISHSSWRGNSRDTSWRGNSRDTGGNADLTPGQDTGEIQGVMLT